MFQSQMEYVCLSRTDTDKKTERSTTEHAGRATLSRSCVNSADKLPEHNWTNGFCDWHLESKAAHS